MSKRRTKTTASSIARKIREGRGKGNFSNYKPWLTIHDVPSQGVVTRILGWKSGRLHHYLSEHFELAHHYQMEWSLEVIDIREQFALLPLEKTLYIAEKLGVKHPIDPKTKHPVVMTTDMLLTIKNGDDINFVAHSIKPISKLNKRVLEKLEIEKQFFKDQGINWMLITEKQINYDLVKNVEWLHSARNIDGLNYLTSEVINKAAPLLFEAIIKEERPLAKTTQEYDVFLGVSPGTCIQVVRYLVANRFWEIDMKKRIYPTLDPLKIKSNQFYSGGVGV